MNNGKRKTSIDTINSDKLNFSAFPKFNANHNKGLVAGQNGI